MLTYHFYPSSHTSASSVPLIIVLDDVDFSFTQAWINQREHTCPILDLGVENWNKNLTPWVAHNPFAQNKEHQDFAGEAHTFLNKLMSSILPEVLQQQSKQGVDISPTSYALCGYSLGGLFSCYGLIHETSISMAASASGSFWYDGWVDYLKELNTLPCFSNISSEQNFDVNKVEDNEIFKQQKIFYSSLGYQEAYKKNGELQLVGSTTDETLEELERLGISVPTFEFTNGTHIQNEPEKLKKAVCWLDYQLSHGDNLTIFIDADACPVIHEAITIARQHKLHVVLAGNTTQNLDAHLSAKTPRTYFDSTDDFYVETVQTSIGKDSADFAIIEEIKPGDICITADIGLASLVLSKHAHAISVRGKIFTKDSINLELALRHEIKRAQKNNLKVPRVPKFTRTQREHFVQQLNFLLRNIK